MSKTNYPNITTNKGVRGTTYSVLIRMRGASTVTATFNRLSDAKKYRDDTKADIRAGRYNVNPQATKNSIGEMIDRFMAAKNLSNNEVGILNWWKSRIGSRMISTVTAADIVKLREELVATPKSDGNPRAPATVNRYLAHLSRAFTMAVREFMIADRNPCTDVSRLKEPQGRLKILNGDERKSLIDACLDIDPMLHEFAVTALSTGARAGELISLDWADIDFKRGIAQLHQTKNGSRRSIPIRGKALGLLKARRGISGPVFHRADGRAFTTYNKQFSAAMDAAGIRDMRFHDLRHCAASALAQNGASLLEIGTLLGHKSPAMTMRYAHLVDSNLIDMGDKLAALMFD